MRTAAGDVGERAAHGPVDLRHAAQAVGVLDLAAVGVRVVERRAGEQPAQGLGGAPLARMRLAGVDTRVAGRGRAEQGVEAERADDVGGRHQLAGVDEGERADRGHDLGPVDQAEALLGAQLTRRQAGGGERVPGRKDMTVEPGVALADQGEREVSERGQVAAGADAAEALPRVWDRVSRIRWLLSDGRCEPGRARRLVQRGRGGGRVALGHAAARAP
jgi:hypothetical protein